MNIKVKLGEKKISNVELKRDFLEWDSERFYSRVGILNRYHTMRDSKFLASSAIEALGIENLDTIDFVLYSTQTPVRGIPGDAAQLLGELGIPANFQQISHGCSAFVSALNLSYALNVANNNQSKFLLVQTDTYSKLISKRDRMNLSLFSDAASACLIDWTEYLRVFSIERSYTESHDRIAYPGDSYNNSTIHEYTQGSWSSNEYFYMHGPDVFRFTMTKVVEVLEEILSNISCKQVILHQANKMIIEGISRKFTGLKFYNDLEDGNLVGASIPRIIEKHNVDFTENTLLLGFGVGLHISGIVLRKK
jgi:3-oxoacyl-[acyl-carrier-protein] synthase-3